MDPTSVLGVTVAGNAVSGLLTALAAFAAAFLILWVVLRFILGNARRIAERSRTPAGLALIGVVQSIQLALIAMVSLWIALQFVTLSDAVARIVGAVFVIALVYLSVQGLQTFLVRIIQRFWLKEAYEAQNMTFLLGVLVRVILWTVGLLLILSNIGVNVTSLLASMGIGGIAVALAVQNILGDVFSSFSLYVDKPFKPGDFIVVGDAMGTVKRIGLKTTRVQALSGEEIIFSNNALTTSRVNNYKRMRTRRVEFRFGIALDTPPDAAAAVPGIVKDLILAQPRTEIERVHLKEIAPDALTIEAAYRVASDDYNVYMDIQQAVNLGILRVLREQGICLAVPQRQVRMEAPPGELRPPVV
jgi:small-conductance mechanosensitive channel